VSNDLDEEHEEEGEGWLVSYADMVTLMFGFFVILYSLSTVEEKKFAELGKSIAAGFKKEAPKISSDAQHESEQVLTEEKQQIRAFQMLVAMLNLGDPNSAVRKVAKAYEAELEGDSAHQLASKLLKDSAKIQIEDRINKSTGIKEDKLTEIILPADDIFERNTANISSSGRSTLLTISKVLLRVADFADFKVESHTNRPDRPGQDVGFAWTLTTSQANAIAVFFIENGVPGSNFSTVGRSYFSPLMPDRGDGTPLSPSDQATNRRIHIILEKR
jgi:chemotaxis protein MotB